MSQKRFYITGNVAGCSQQEAVKALEHIEYNLKITGATNIFNSSQIDRNLKFLAEMKIRMEEIAKADVIIFSNDWNSCVECKLEWMEAARLKKDIRRDNPGDYDDIRKNFVGD